MPRKPRESSGTGIYHVMLRGINRQDIFDDTEDYWTFIKMMSAVPCYIYAYCLMPNHVHLLIAEKSLKVGEVVKESRKGRIGKDSKRLFQNSNSTLRIDRKI